MAVLQQIVSSYGVYTPPTTDSFFPSVSFLLGVPGSSGNQNRSFVDSSPNNLTITRITNVSQGSFSPFAPTGWSTYYTSGNYQTLPTSAALQLGTNNFTIECWFNTDTLSAAQEFIGNLDGNSNTRWGITVDTSGILRFQGWTAVWLTASAALKTGNWNHIAISRDGSTSMAMFLNGTRVALNTTDNISLTDTAQIVVGREASGASPVTGYISNIRIINGSAIYPTANSTITVPTAPLTAVTNTVLLMNQNNRTIDNSTNAFSITTTGAPVIKSFSPFPPSSAYSTSNGGNAYFDGSSYLSLPTGPVPTSLSFSTSDFTFETWVYPTTITGLKFLYADCDGSINNGSVLFYLNGGTIVFEQYTGVSSSQISTSSFTVPLNRWSHIAVSRVGTNLYIGFNGVIQTFTGRPSTMQTPTGTPTLGVEGGTLAQNFIGYMSGFRILKGTALYTSNYTVPTTAPTSITNTSFLLNGTNSGVINSIAFNDIQCFGGAQPSTTQVKYGTSVVFNGSVGTYTTCFVDPIYNIRTSDFTIEYWVYINSLNTIGVHLSYGGVKTTGTPDTAGWSCWTSISTLVFNTNTTEITFGSITAGAWHHVAFSRSGTSLRCFLNGTQSGTTQTNSTDINNTTFPLVLGSGYEQGTSGASTPLNGYLSNVRITKGVARYTSNFTAPTAGFPLQ